MTQWNPIWNVEIDGVAYTNAILANLTISSGRRNIYEQAQAGYVNLQLIDVNQATIPVSINSSITVQIRDSSNTLIPIFGGNVVDIGLEVYDVGSTTFTQTYSIIALGALARLPKILVDGVLSKDFDGDQIYDVLSDILLNNWAEVPGALSWGTYTPVTETWANAQNLGLGEIDQPGEYELAARTSNRTDVYSLVSGLATSGLGYIYEDAFGRISYAAALHRSLYLQANGYVNLTANHARATGIRIDTRAGDVRNSITIKYGATSSSEESAADAASQLTYGSLAQIITTTLHNSADALDQAEFYLALRANPQPIFSEVTFDLTNDELDNSDRDNLLNVFMGQPILLNDLPPNMSASAFQGFVEGWSFQASYNQLSVSLNLSPVAYSLQALEWQQISAAFTWAGVSGSLDWQRATIIT
jgi:hypothetical protein